MNDEQTEYLRRDHELCTTALELPRYRKRGYDRQTTRMILRQSRHLKTSAYLLFASLFVLVWSAAAEAQPNAESQAIRAPESICASCIRGNMEFLASDAMQGRGSGTHDELVAATFIAVQLRAYGVDPAGDKNGYIQQATITHENFAKPPRLTFRMPGAGAPDQNVA